MFSLKIERVNRNHNYFVRLYLDDGRNLFDWVMPSLPILVVRKIVPAKLACVLGRLARALCDGNTNLSLTGAAFPRLLTSMVGKSDCFHFAAVSTILTFPGIRPKCQAEDDSIYTASHKAAKDQKQ